MYSVQNMEDLGMTWNISQSCTKTALPKINETFQYGKIFFLISVWCPCKRMVGAFIDGQFYKYFNNECRCKTLLPGST